MDWNLRNAPIFESKGRIWSLSLYGTGASHTGFDDLCLRSLFHFTSVAHTHTHREHASRTKGKITEQKNNDSFSRQFYRKENIRKSGTRACTRKKLLFLLKKKSFCNGRKKKMIFDNSPCHSNQRKKYKSQATWL